MSKNTSSSAFRKIDVDQFDEANFKDDEGPAQDSGFAGVSESEIANLLQQGKADEALKVLLASAPVGSKNQADKVSEISILFPERCIFRNSDLNFDNLCCYQYSGISILRAFKFELW